MWLQIAIIITATIHLLVYPLLSTSFPLRVYAPSLPIGPFVLCITTFTVYELMLFTYYSDFQQYKNCWSPSWSMFDHTLCESLTRKPLLFIWCKLHSILIT